MVDARLSDGSRVNAIIPPLAVDGPLLSIRRFGTDKLMPEDLVEKRSMTPGMLRVLEAAVRAQPQHHRLGRHRRRQDDAAECALGLHLAQRADRHHRRRGRVAAQAAAPGAPGDAPRQPGGPGRGAAAAAADQRAAHAARPHHRRRGARRGGARHAAGHEYRPRRLADHGARQQPARRHFAAGGDGHAGQRQYAPHGHPAADRLGGPHPGAVLAA